jgi:hypothetical protein
MLVFDTFTPCIDFGNITTNPCFNFLGTGIFTVEGDVQMDGDLDVDGDVLIDGHVGAGSSAIVSSNVGYGFTEITLVDLAAFAGNPVIDAVNVSNVSVRGAFFSCATNNGSNDQTLLCGATTNLTVGTTYSGTIATICGADYHVNLGFLSNITEAFGLKVSEIRKPVAGTLATAYGLYLGDVSSASTGWSIFSLGGDMAHAGNVRIGSLVAPTVALDVTGDAAVSGSSTLGDDAAVDLVTVNADLIGNGGRRKNTTRLTANTTLDNTHHEVFCDTDGGAITVTLPAGVDGRTYTIKNVGTSGNAVTLTPDGSDLLFGENSDYIILDRGDDEQITYETTEGWG